MNFIRLNLIGFNSGYKNISGSVYIFGSEIQLMKTVLKIVMFL